ncbi:MAG: ABC transporter permease, partial [Mesorhizobium sp.]
HRTLPRQMFDGIRDNIDPSILAMSTLLILATVALVLALAFISRVQSRLRSTVQE